MNLLRWLHQCLSLPPDQRSGKGAHVRRHGKVAKPNQRTAKTRRAQRIPTARPVKTIWHIFKRTNKRQNHVIAYHGTPQLQNARSILRHGWMVSAGNAYGDGVYLATDLSTAQGYARGGGVIIKCRVRLNRCCHWDTTWQKRYDEWCRKRNVVANNSAKTAFLIQSGMRVLRSGNIIVVLSPQYANATAWKLRRPEIKILSVHKSPDMKTIQV